jgi:predicted nucleotidyltransferase
LFPQEEPITPDFSSSVYLEKTGDSTRLPDIYPQDVVKHVLAFFVRQTRRHDADGSVALPRRRTLRGEHGAMTESEFGALVQKAVAALKAAGAREVYLFGSAAKGALRENSDVDMAVSGLPPEVFFRAMGQASRALGRPVDLINLDRDDPFTRYLRESSTPGRVRGQAE